MFTVRNFLKAAAKGDTNAVADFLRRGDGRDCIPARDSAGNTALHLAAMGGFGETAALLIKNGCDVHALNDQGFTPLCSAAMQNAPKAIPLLLDAGANVNVDVPNWISPLNIALSRHTCNPQIAQMLLDAKADPNKGKPLVQAMDNKLFDLADQMLQAGADPNVTGSSSYRPLHYAAQNGELALVRTLLEKGAEIDPQEYSGNTPLLLAIAQGHTKVVELLLEKGADIEIQNTYGRSAYAQAREGRNNAQIRELVGSRVRAAAEERTTPLNATADALPARNASTWVLMGDAQVAHVSVHPALGRRLTEIFNFESRERLIISENLKTRAENITPPLPFDETPEPLLKKALAAFRDLGGQADDDVVFGTRVPKKVLKP